MFWKTHSNHRCGLYLHLSLDRSKFIDLEGFSKLQAVLTKQVISDHHSTKLFALTLTIIPSSSMGSMGFPRFLMPPSLYWRGHRRSEELHAGPMQERWGSGFAGTMLHGGPCRGFCVLRACSLLTRSSDLGGCSFELDEFRWRCCGALINKNKPPS